VRFRLLLPGGIGPAEYLVGLLGATLSVCMLLLTGLKVSKADLLKIKADGLHLTNPVRAIKRPAFVSMTRAHAVPSSHGLAC
jgi:hypothetical protein